MKNKYIAFVGIAFELTGLVIVFLYLGQWLDQKWEQNGIATAAGAFVALGIWIAHLMYLMKKWDD